MNECVCLCYRNSFQCGVMCLRRLNYDRKELERRREESMLEFKGNTCFFLSSLKQLGVIVHHSSLFCAFRCAGVE